VKPGLKKGVIPTVFVHENLISQSAQNSKSTRESNVQCQTEIFRRELFRQEVSFKINIFLCLIVMKQNMLTFKC